VTRTHIIVAPALVLALTMPAPAAVRFEARGPRPAPDAASVIKTMLAAPALIDYEGTKVISTVRGARAETVTILEAYKRLGRLRLEFLSPESVSGRLIVDDGADTWQYEPSMHLVIRGPSFVQGTGSPERAEDILRRYTVSVLGREAVIGRDTVVLALAPGTGGSNRHLWVDQATGVVLRTEERDAGGEIVYVSYFSRISYSLNLPTALFTFRRPAGAKILSFHVSGDRVTTADELRRQAGTSIVAPPRLLNRYVFRDGRVARHGAFAAAAATYSDGVGVVTVFQTPTSRMAFPNIGKETVVGSMGGPLGRFLDLGYFRVLLWQAGATNFAVLGNVPQSVLIAIANELTGTK
jgi:outer membrane lipoprotein-sorting protein